MSRTPEDQALLDEKIARIRKQNEEIMRRKQMIDEEIEYFKGQNAFVNSKCSAESEIDFPPTLYSDTKLNRSKAVTDNKYTAYEKNFPSRERNRNRNDDAEWRAERNRIDEERIRRQRNNCGWRREWDADKVNDGYEPKYESRHQLPVDDRTKMQNISTDRPKMRNNERNDNRNEKPYETMENVTLKKNISTSNSANTCKNTKTKLIKRVSWASDENLADEDNVCLAKNMKNIVVRVGNSENVSNKRSIQITDVHKSPTLSGVRNNQLTDLDSEHIKTCVAKTINSNFVPVRLDYDKRKTARLKVQSSNLRNPSSTENVKPSVLKKVNHTTPSQNLVPVSKPTVTKNVNVNKTFSGGKETIVTYNEGENNLKNPPVHALNKRIARGKSIPDKEINSNKMLMKTKGAVNVDYGNDEEWEDASDGEWEDV